VCSILLAHVAYQGSREWVLTNTNRSTAFMFSSVNIGTFEKPYQVCRIRTTYVVGQQTIHLLHAPYDVVVGCYDCHRMPPSMSRRSVLF
jgi:hypothetical protein